MSNAKFARLVMVTSDNNNKYYELSWDGISSNFSVKYGRIKSTAQTCTYPISQWQSKYNEKTKKGYKDVTHTVATIIKDEVKEDKKESYKAIENAKVDRFLTLMKQYTDNLVKSTYTVKYNDVTLAQVQEAQKYIDELTTIDKKDVTSINNKLLELYMVIPRYMGNVRDHLLPNIDVGKTIQQEQDNLDAMASQVKMYKEDKKETKKVKKEDKTLLDLLGIKKMQEISSTKEIDRLVKQITGEKIEAIFEVDKDAENTRFSSWLDAQQNKDTRFVFHGTKNMSVIPILEQGLKIRPSGKYQFSGKAYGDGNYFSDEFSTSIGYTGGGSDKVLLIYEIHVGNVSRSHFRNYSDCKRAGYDSFYGGWLRVSYKEEQARIKYIIWLK